MKNEKVFWIAPWDDNVTGELQLDQEGKKRVKEKILFDF